MNKRFIISITVIVLCVVQIGCLSSSATVRLRMTNNTITTNQNVTFDFIGLNESQMYIVTFTNHASTIANVTFTSSGFEHLEYVFIPNDNDTWFTISLYQYSSSTLQNSSVSLLSLQLSEIKPTDYNRQNAILANMYVILPIMIGAIFALLILKPLKKKLK